MAETPTYMSICRDLRAGRPSGIYLLHGEEGYYIDALVRQFEALVPESERDFDLTTLYAPELSSPLDVVNACKRYPMFGTRQVVIVKEAQTQGANFLNALAAYAQAPAPTTVLCICCRGQQARGADFLKALKASGGVCFESKKVTDRNISSVVAEFIREQGLSVDPKALTMLSDFVGTDLSRIYNEVGKLTITLGKGAMVTPEAVERNIGISKDYNNFEFLAAIASRDEAKALTILSYFRANPKNNPVQVIAVVLFNYFANLLSAYYATDRSDHGLMQELGFRWPAQLKDIKTGMQNYGPWHVIEIISLIRRFDCASKGNGSRLAPHDLLFDLTYRILHPLGQKGVRI
ncbi:MAG: DNA polymerase III subunit delta [Muribaculaceae bacterium]|nr:DNA polymerase III subunit delta [Muribaculaceae bacterium]